MAFSHTDLLAALNDLLEAERAGARVTLETAHNLSPPNLAQLVLDIQRDEVRWCGMLMKVIKYLGEEPSHQTGAFYEKAMAISDIQERLTFLNRGQGWVVRRLQSLIPMVENTYIRSELELMLTAHEINIERVNNQIQT